MLRKGQVRRVRGKDVARQNRFINQLIDLVAPDDSRMASTDTLLPFITRGEVLASSLLLNRVARRRATITAPPESPVFDILFSHGVTHLE
jgi:hypothetical protein